MCNQTIVKHLASLEDLDEIRDFISRQLADHGCDPDTTYDVQLAVVELMTNSIIHGYKGKPGYVEIEVEQNGTKMLVFVRDHAAQFDPTQALPPDLSLPLEQRCFGGMGIYLVKQIVNEMKYQPLPQGGNEVTLVINKRPD